jgi:hypothetical protein
MQWPEALSQKLEIILALLTEHEHPKSELSALHKSEAAPMMEEFIEASV